MNRHIKDDKEVEKKIQEMRREGPQRLHVVIDFDRTMTYAKKNGPKSGAFFDRLDSSTSISDISRKKMQELFAYYYPIETDHTLTYEQKIPYMQEWWDKYFNVLKEERLPEAEITRIAQEGVLEFRKDYEEFHKLLANNNIPLLIFSAGLGNGIVEMLKHHNILTQNVHIISNFLEFENGLTVRRKKPYVHTFNKNESILDNEYKNEVINRDNVVLIGDSLGDITMADGLEHNCLLKIGYLNFDTENKLDIYKEKYDIVLTGDGSFSPILDILKKIIGVQDAR